MQGLLPLFCVAAFYLSGDLVYPPTEARLSDRAKLWMKAWHKIAFRHRRSRTRYRVNAGDVSWPLLKLAL